MIALMLFRLKSSRSPHLRGSEVFQQFVDLPGSNVAWFPPPLFLSRNLPFHWTTNFYTPLPYQPELDKVVVMPMVMPSF